MLKNMDLNLQFRDVDRYQMISSKKNSRKTLAQIIGVILDEVFLERSIRSKNTFSLGGSIYQSLQNSPFIKLSIKGEKKEIKKKCC